MKRYPHYSLPPKDDLVIRKGMLRPFLPTHTPSKPPALTRPVPPESLWRQLIAMQQRGSEQFHCNIIGNIGHG